MKTLTASMLAPLLALAISAPIMAWATPEEAPQAPIPTEEVLEIEQQESAEESKKSGKDAKIDRLFDRISKKLDDENSELSEEEKEELREGLYDAKEALKELDEINIKIGGDGDGVSIPEMFVAILAITLSLGGPIIIVAIALYSSFKKRRLTHDTINNYVAAGKDIPTEVLQ
ncbi:MAG: hypothetical protein OIF34_03875, partial [Porticoccaceae bacterium]|nr:hypothetical protein [Porticoccaceae bacterium]